MWGPWGPFGFSGESIEKLWVSFGVPFEAFGAIWAYCWIHFGSCRLLWDLFGVMMASFLLRGRNRKTIDVRYFLCYFDTWGTGVGPQWPPKGIIWTKKLQRGAIYSWELSYLPLIIELYTPERCQEEPKEPPRAPKEEKRSYDQLQAVSNRVARGGGGG